jgi:hypothetical protein
MYSGIRLEILKKTANSYRQDRGHQAQTRTGVIQNTSLDRNLLVPRNWKKKYLVLCAMGISQEGRKLLQEGFRAPPPPSPGALLYSKQLKLFMGSVQNTVA